MQEDYRTDIRRPAELRTHLTTLKGRNHVKLDGLTDRAPEEAVTGRSVGLAQMIQQCSGLIRLQTPSLDQKGSGILHAVLGRPQEL